MSSASPPSSSSSASSDPSSASPASSDPSSVHVAWILAAGLGTRLRPLTDERPKPLVEVCGTPLVGHCLQLLHDAGVTHAALNSHWLHPRLPTSLGARSFDVALRYTHEPVVLGTGGGLAGLRAVLPAPAGERALIANADALIDLDVRGLLAMPDDALATLVLQQVPDVERYGAIATDDDERIVGFAGRVPLQGPVARERMFCGWHLVHPRVLDVLPPTTLQPGSAEGALDDVPVATGTETCINKQGYPTWMKQGALLRAFDHTGLFVDVGTPERLWDANVKLLSGQWQPRFLRPFARFVERPGRVFVSSTRAPSLPPSWPADVVIEGPCVIDDDVVIGAGARIGPMTVLGRGCVVGPGAVVTHAVLQSGARVEGDVRGVVVGNACRIPI